MKGYFVTGIVVLAIMVAVFKIPQLKSLVVG